MPTDYASVVERFDALTEETTKELKDEKVKVTLPEPFDPSAAGPSRSRKRRVEEVEEGEEGGGRGGLSPSISI